MTAKEKKRILILTPRFPYPILGGDRLRIYQVCKELSNFFSLTLLSLCETKNELNIPVPQDGVFDTVERVLLTKFKSYINTFLCLPTQTPLQVAYYRSHNFDALIKKKLPDHDAVLSHLIRCAEYVKDVDKFKILEMTDAISLNYNRVKKNKKTDWLKTMIYGFEAKRLLEYERQIIKKFNYSVLVSNIDKSFLTKGQKDDCILTCSNGVDLENMPFVDRQQSKSVIVYIGKMTTVQNMDACIYFAKKVMPVLLSKIDVVFRIVGEITLSNASQFKLYPNIEVTGRVSSISDAVADAMVGVCPIRMGAGVQNKILEYMALGLPVITSSIGLEGLSALPDRDILIAETPSEYLKHIVRIWKDKEFSGKLAKNARNYVEYNHNWSVQLSPLVEKFKTALYNSAFL